MDAIPVPTFERHNRCLHCGYDLFGQARSGVCPECGTSTRESARQEALLGLPGNMARLREGSVLLLVSSILAGLCPGVCMLFLWSDESLVVAALMSLIFAATAWSSAAGEQRFRVLFEGNEVDGFDGSGAVAATQGSSRLRYDVLAATGLLSLNLAAYASAIGRMSIGSADKLLTFAVAIGFALLSITAWRAAPAYALRGRVASACLGKTRSGFVSLGMTKAIYETAWLACCWIPMALAAVDAEDAAVFFAMAAFAGLLGFAGIWIAMIVTHALLVRDIRTRFGQTARGFEVVATAGEPRTL